ncbi:MAG: tandem-95 repeat protein [Hormoscilla sp. GM102CHS1]|nr:tandem-95 repeat protein [Hormoscilla sp. GM102CHS1]
MPNEAPEAGLDQATVELGTTGTIQVLANDTDDNNDVLSITGFSLTSEKGGENARDRNNNNSLHYTPANGFRGTDSFSYSIDDGNGGTSSATVTITVPNKAPEAGNDSATVSLGTTGTIDVLSNDSDDNNDVLEITGFSLTSEKGGKNARRGNSLHYTPADGFRGTDSFSYSIDDDNGGTSSATVTITVPNKAPEAGNDSAIMLLGTTGTIQVLANDTDDNSDVLSITGFSLTSEKGGENARDGNNNSLRYTPANGFRGTDSFSYSIDDDNGGTSSATVTITVPNVAPSAVNDSATVSLGTTGIIQVLANDTDDNNDVLSVTGFSLNSEKGGENARDRNSLHYTPAARFRGTDSFEYSISDGNGGIDSATATITVPNVAPEAGNDEAIVSLGTTGTIDALANDTDINGDELSITGFSATLSQGGAIARDGNSLHYTPANGFRGTDSFSYSISDGNGGTDSATVTITVPNKAPEAVNDEATVSLGTTGTIDVLENDSDDNNDVLEITRFSLTSSQGGAIAHDGNSLIYTPPASFRGTDSFSYSIEDGNGGTDSATVTITVPNKAPEAVNDEDLLVPTITTMRISVLNNDTDANGDELLITNVSSTLS